MKVIRYILLIITFAILPCVQAQTEFSRKALKKELKAKLKAEKYGEADVMLRKAMEEHKELKLEPEFNFKEMEIQDKLAEAENRKIFLSSGQDTAKFFSYIYGVYNYALATGYGTKKYSRSISNHLLQYRNNLRSAGLFHYKKGQYNEAYKYIDMYLATTDYPLLLSHKDYKADTDTVALARLASISAFGAKQFNNALYYLDMALTDTVNMMNMYEIGVKAALAKGDSLTAFGYMEDGWKRDSTNRFFCFALLDYYQEHHEYSRVRDVIATALSTVPEARDSTTRSRLYYIRGKAEELSGLEDLALISMDSVTAFCPTDTNAYLCKGNIYLRRAQVVTSSNSATPGSTEYKKFKSQVMDLYSSAVAEFEKVKSLAAKQPSLWLSPLRECYYQLNKGKELKRLEQYEKKS